MPPLPRRALGCGDLCQRPPDVQGGSPSALRSIPGHRPVERVIQLEDSWAVTVGLQGSPVASGEPRAGKVDQLLGTDVAEDDFCRREFLDRGHGGTRFNLATERAQV